MNLSTFLKENFWQTGKQIFKTNIFKLFDQLSTDTTQLRFRCFYSTPPQHCHQPAFLFFLKFVSKRDGRFLFLQTTVSISIFKYVHFKTQLKWKTTKNDTCEWLLTPTSKSPKSNWETEGLMSMLSKCSLSVSHTFCFSIVKWVLNKWTKTRHIICIFLLWHTQHAILHFFLNVRMMAKTY